MAKTYGDGLRDAARLLISTAQDYEQMQERSEDVLRSSRLVLPGERTTAIRTAAICQEKAALLRGQAQHILYLEKNQ